MLHESRLKKLNATISSVQRIRVLKLSSAIILPLFSIVLLEVRELVLGFERKRQPIASYRDKMIR